MSIEVMTALWKTCLYDGNMLNVLLAMADWASDDGGDIFPGIETLAGKARCSIRTTQGALRRFEADEILEQIANSKGGRGKVTEYKINLERVQELQGLHEAENPDCPHCAARRKSAEKRVQYRAQRVQAATSKGAATRQKGAEPREHIDNNRHHPSENHQHSPPALPAAESGNVASLGKGEPERWPQFRDAVAETWPNGFPADNEAACKFEFERQTKSQPADLLIACVRLYGADLHARQAARGKHAGPMLIKRPSNFLKEGDWRGYARKVEENAAAEQKLVTQLGNVQRAFGPALFQRMREAGIPDAALAILDGVMLEGTSRFLHITGFQRTTLERYESKIERLIGERPTYTLIKRAAS